MSDSRGLLEACHRLIIIHLHRTTISWQCLQSTSGSKLDPNHNHNDNSTDTRGQFKRRLNGWLFECANGIGTLTEGTPYKCTYLLTNINLNPKPYTQDDTDIIWR